MTLPKIRSHAELTAARDALVVAWRELLARLEAAHTVKDLDAIIWSAVYQHATTALADLANAVVEERAS